MSWNKGAVESTVAQIRRVDGFFSPLVTPSVRVAIVAAHVLSVVELQDADVILRADIESFHNAVLDKLGLHRS